MCLSSQQKWKAKLQNWRKTNKEVHLPIVSQVLHPKELPQRGLGLNRENIGRKPIGGVAFELMAIHQQLPSSGQTLLENHPLAKRWFFKRTKPLSSGISKLAMFLAGFKKSEEIRRYFHPKHPNSKKFGRGKWGIPPSSWACEKIPSFLWLSKYLVHSLKAVVRIRSTSPGRIALDQNLCHLYCAQIWCFP